MIPLQDVTVNLVYLRVVQDGLYLPDVEALLLRVNDAGCQSLQLIEPLIARALAPAEDLRKIVARPKWKNAERNGPVVENQALSAGILGQKHECSITSHCYNDD